MGRNSEHYKTIVFKEAGKQNAYYEQNNRKEDTEFKAQNQE